MHRKFIALIVATAITITGVSVSQARAADTGDILGGLAAIAIIGAAVNHYNKEKRKDREAAARQNTPVYTAPQINRHKVKPLPRRVARYDLQQRCLRTHEGYGQRPVLGTQCLDRHYKHANSLPEQCKIGFWNGKKIRRAYEPACLRQQGYRVVYE
ncbi:MAG: hypothetical protein AAF625_14820 [Pseudomonadota bacterium]